MSTHWMLETKADPIGTTQEFLGKLFRVAALDSLLVLIHTGGAVGVKAQIVSALEDLGLADPFAPLMTTNAAGLVLDFLKEQPGRRLGAVLRPCEMHALLERSKRDRIALDCVMLIGVDCVGTFSEADFEWRGGADPLTHEALQFMRQGGIAPYRYRPACQMCTEPMPEEADLMIDLLGLPARKVILISAREPETAAQFHLAELTQGEAPPELVAQHSHMHLELSNRRARARHRIQETLETDLIMDVDALVDHLAGCAPCRECLNACPMVAGGEERLSREAVTGWLMSCVGCGICEEACSKHLPLTAIFARIREELTTVMD